MRGGAACFSAGRGGASIPAIQPAVKVKLNQPAVKEKLKLIQPDVKVKGAFLKSSLLWEVSNIQLKADYLFRLGKVGARQILQFVHLS